MKPHSAMKWLPVGKLVADAGNPRDGPLLGIEALAASIRRQGILQPLRVGPEGPDGKHPVRCGHRRLAAAKLAGLTEVPVVVVDGEHSDAERLVEQLHENLHRQDLKPLEQAEAFRRAIQETGWTAQQLADELALSPASVGRALALLNLPADVRQLIADGRLAPSSALEWR